MVFYSPLRYPGGKQRLAKFIARICEKNDINGHYVEPYAGGASVALHLLLEGYVNKITINDKDQAIYALWYSVLYDTDRLCKKINNTNITIQNWKKQKNVLRGKNNEKDLLKLGFSTLFLNRTNYSGVLDGGVIGGLSQKGQYKMDCRFNKRNLIKRIKLIASYEDSITVENLDALDLIKKVKKDRNTIFYFDPPYYLKGPSLYMNHYRYEDHKKVSKKIKKMKNAHWIISYDNNPVIQDLYKEFQGRCYSLNHSVLYPRIGKEVIFADKRTALPSGKIT